MKKEVYTGRNKKIALAIIEAKKSGEVVYKSLETFKAWVKIPKKTLHSHWTIVEIRGKNIPLYHAGKVGVGGTVLNMNFFNISNEEIGKTRRFIVSVEVKILPDGRFYLGLKLIRKDFEGDAPELTVVVDGNIPKTAIATYQAKNNNISPVVCLKEQK